MKLIAAVEVDLSMLDGYNEQDIIDGLRARLRQFYVGGGDEVVTSSVHVAVERS